MNWLETYEANLRKIKKPTGIILNTKFGSTDIDTDTEIDYEIATNFMKHYKKYFLKRSFSNNAIMQLPQVRKMLQLRVIHKQIKLR